ncbi:porin family protein [Anditalea andensis]|uniref:Uncharacterized protein n=1 Tax=Anditalea andensis TaxID=1048983 RepID=A0A074LGI0_9BACT|nr:outer membrane beta-barrel protein [Anditalea andensis]KEO72902.1 hypothetical protein EL17_14865 [Anditalea andensis]
MKKLLFILSFVLMASLAEAQTRGEARLQIGGDYAFNTEFFGVNLGAEYFLTDKISIAPNHTIYFPETGRASNLNIDARYYFTEDILQWYGMAGFTNNWINPELEGINAKTSTAGANIGVGGVLKFADRFAFNPEFKYQIQNQGQLVFRLGLVYILN